MELEANLKRYSDTFVRTTQRNGKLGFFIQSSTLADSFILQILYREHSLDKHNGVGVFSTFHNVLFVVFTSLLLFFIIFVVRWSVVTMCCTQNPYLQDEKHSKQSQQEEKAIQRAARHDESEQFVGEIAFAFDHCCGIGELVGVGFACSVTDLVLGRKLLACEGLVIACGSYVWHVIAIYLGSQCKERARLEAAAVAAAAAPEFEGALWYTVAVV